MSVEPKEKQQFFDGRLFFILADPLSILLKFGAVQTYEFLKISKNADK